MRYGRVFFASGTRFLPVLTRFSSGQAGVFLRKFILFALLLVLAVGCPFITYRQTEPRYPAHAFPAEASPKDAPAARVYEGTITLPTVNVSDASYTPPPYPMDQVGRGYPYPNLDHGRRRGRNAPGEDRTHRTVVLENEYLKVTTLPDLGGRVFEAIFKPTREQMFYRAERLEPFNIWECATSWMFATGGLRFEFPYWGHDRNTEEPWEYELHTWPNGTASVSYTRVDERTGLRFRNHISLDPGRTWIRLNCELSNPTDASHRCMVWIITGLTGTKGIEFVMPSEYAVEHGGEKSYRWPVAGGVDWSYFKNWPRMQAFFALDWKSNFSGLYDHGKEHGVVRWARARDMPGLKLWGAPRWGEGYYVSLYGGASRTMEEKLTLRPGEVKSWEELWYPLAGTRGLTEATRELALSLHTDGGKLVVAMMPTRVYPGASVRVARGEKTLLERSVDLTPKKAFVETVDFAGDAKTVTVRVTGAEGRVLIDRTLGVDKIRPAFKASIKR